MALDLISDNNMGKRSALASDAAPKRAKHAAAGSPEDVPRSAADQQGRRQATRAPAGAAAVASAAAVAPSREQVLAEFDPQVWAQEDDMPEGRKEDLKKRLKEALKPTADGCWSVLGAPMPKVQMPHCCVGVNSPQYLQHS